MTTVQLVPTPLLVFAIIRLCLKSNLDIIDNASGNQMKINSSYVMSLNLIPIMDQSLRGPICIWNDDLYSEIAKELPDYQIEVIKNDPT
jgi:hypothetical protein